MAPPRAPPGGSPLCSSTARSWIGLALFLATSIGRLPTPTSSPSAGSFTPPPPPPWWAPPQHVPFLIAHSPT
eukprot:6450587-Alexandrium_andersonii.AAC.1